MCPANQSAKYVPPFILQRWADPLSGGPRARYCADAKNWVVMGPAFPMPWVGQWYLWQRTDDFIQVHSQSFHTIWAGLGRTPPPFWPTLECSEPRDHRPCIGSVSWPHPLLVSVSWSKMHFLCGLSFLICRGGIKITCVLFTGVLEA